MSAAPIELKLPEESYRGAAVYGSRLFFGRYVPYRSVIIPSVEGFWLVASSLGVFMLYRALAGVSGPLPWAQAGMLAVIYLAAWFLMDLYDRKSFERRQELMGKLVEAMGLVCVAVSAVQYIFGFLTFPVTLALLQICLTAAFTIFARTVIGPRLVRREGALPIGFIGHARTRAEIEKARDALSSLGFAIESLGESVQQAAWFRQRVQAGRLRHLVIDDACLGKGDGWAFLEQCVSSGVEIVSFGTFCERALGKVTLGPSLIGELHAAERSPGNILRDRLRRWRDLVAGTIALAVALPVGLLLAVAIKCDSPGPVFFVQERVGRNGRRFRMFKFRSMYHNMPAPAGPAWTTRASDPRITRVGAIMRLFHFDELPQLLNVLRGDMSLVGPRPFHPEHCAELDGSPFFRLRLLVPPGITGWAQIRCNYEASVDDHQEVLARDLFYVKHTSLLFDLFVLCDTIRVCLWRKGAR